MSFTHLDAAPLIAEKTGIPLSVAKQWLACEAQSVNNPTNPLNIISLLGKAGYPQKGRPVQVGHIGGFGTYASVEDGCADVAWLIHNGPYAVIRSALAANPVSEFDVARAIEKSAWAAGHYGNSCISSHFASTPPVTPPKPPVPPTPPKPPTTNTSGYLVRAGDSLSAIAARFLGDASRWIDIYNLNRGRIGADPNLIHPGQLLVMPDGSTHPATPPTGTKSYTVQSGDTLSAISKKFYGDERLWNRIYQANRTAIGNDPGLIHPGMRLVIPPK